MRAFNVKQANTAASEVASDWLRRWYDFSRPITKRIKGRPKQCQITFENQLKMALIVLSERGIFCMSLCLSLFLIIFIVTVSAFTYLFERKKSRVHGNQSLCMNFASLLELSSVFQLSFDLRITIRRRPDHC